MRFRLLEKNIVPNGLNTIDSSAIISKPLDDRYKIIEKKNFEQNIV